MKTLLITTSLLEVVFGLVLLLSPELPVPVLIGTSLNTQAGLVVGRLAGVALVTLGLACWMARNDLYSRSAAGLVSAMLFYNVAAVTLLTYVGIGLRLSGIGLWPTIILHLALGVWCIICLRHLNNLSRNKEIKP